MSSIWTLVHGVTEQTLEQWGLGRLTRELRNAETDRVMLHATGLSVDAASLFSYGDTVILKRDGVQWFYGRVLKEPRMGNSRGEELRYELAGPWWYLEDLVYQQKWTVNGGTQVYKGRVILGQGDDGSDVNSGAVITDAIQYAITAGRPIALGTIDPTLQPPKDENKDITCAEVIRKMMAWNPDCVAYWDYTTAPYPTLHVRKVANLTATSLGVAEGDLIEGLEIRARNDLQRSAVVIRYEIGGATDGKPWMSIVSDAYPVGATGMEVGAVVLTVPLDGAKATTVSQDVKTRVIQTSVATDDDIAATTAYWKKLIPALAASNVSDITFNDIPGETAGTKFKRALVDPDELDGSGAPVVLDATLANELVQGAVTNWMRDDQSVKAQLQAFTANISFTRDGVAQESRLYSHQITVTDAVTGTYSTLKSYEGGEAVPTGLAEAFYNAVSVLPFEGRVMLVEGECSGTVAMGQKLNLTSGLSAWATMAMPVQKITEQVDYGKTEVVFGPLGVLSVEDLVALLRVTRPGVRFRMGDGNTGAAAGRTTGKAAQPVGLGAVPVNSNTSMLPDQGIYPFQMVNASGGGHAKISFKAGTVMAQGGGYESPIRPKVWDGSAWTAIDSGAVMQFADAAASYLIYMKAQFNFTRYTRKIGILATTGLLPSEQQPLDSYTTGGEDTTGWTTSAGTPDNATDCGLSYKLMGGVTVGSDGVGGYQVTSISSPQDVQSSLGFVPACTGGNVWYGV